MTEEKREALERLLAVFDKHPVVLDDEEYDAIEQAHAALSTKQDAEGECGAGAARAMLAALKVARVTIRALHDVSRSKASRQMQWDIYEKHSPEMKAIDIAIAQAEAAGIKEDTQHD